MEASDAAAPTEALFPEEMALLQRALPQRRAEFATARRCARQALAELGVASAPILSGPRREPMWPDGIVGSITHCSGYHAAAVARAADVRSIGIDAEPDSPLPEDTLELVSLPGERGQLKAAWGPSLDRLLFSAKESVYKTWFPLARRWLGFTDAFVTLHRDGSFDAELAAGEPVHALRGQWRAGSGLIVTAIAVPAVPPQCP